RWRSRKIARQSARRMQRVVPGKPSVALTSAALRDSPTMTTTVILARSSTALTDENHVRDSACRPEHLLYYQHYKSYKDDVLELSCHVNSGILPSSERSCCSCTACM